MNKAMDQLKSIPIKSTIGYYLTFIILGMLTAALSPLIPTLAERTASSLDRLSTALAASAFGYMIGAFIGGRLYDRLPGHRILFFLLFVSGILISLVPFLSVLWVLGGVLFVLGTMEGAMDTGGNSLLVWIHGDRVAPFMNGLHFFFGVGAFLAPIAVVNVARWSGYEMGGLWLFGIVAAVSSIFFLRLPSPQSPAHTVEVSERNANAILVAFFLLFFFLYVGAEVAYGNWIYTYAFRLDLASAENAAYLTSAFWGSFTLGRLLGIPIAVRLRPRTIMLFDFIGCFIFLGMILAWPGSSTVLWIATLGVGFSMASIFPAAISFAERTMPLTGKVTGWFLVGTGAGGMFMPWLSGQLFDNLGMGIMIWITLVSLILNLLVLGLILGYRRKKDIQAG